MKNSKFKIYSLNKIHKLSNNIKFSFIDSNHCPGAVMIIFWIKLNGKLYKVLNTGDFRYNENSHQKKFEAVTE